MHNYDGNAHRLVTLGGRRPIRPSYRRWASDESRHTDQKPSLTSVSYSKVLLENR